MMKGSAYTQHRVMKCTTLDGSSKRQRSRNYLIRKGAWRGNRHLPSHKSTGGCSIHSQKRSPATHPEEFLIRFTCSHTAHMGSACLHSTGAQNEQQGEIHLLEARNCICEE